MPRRRRREAPRHRAGSSGASPPSASSILFFPKSPFFQADPAALRQINCKRGCLAVVKTDGTVVFWVGAEEGGERSWARKPRVIKLRKNAKVNSLDCKISHLLILSSEGKLSEHSLAIQNVKSEPRLLKELGDKQIVQIACGDHHSMALSRGGELFSWGQNEYGQLGLERKMNYPREPQLVQALRGIPLAKIAAGGFHSMAVSLSGSVYSWGRNAFGQLGLGDAKARSAPTYVKALEHKKMVFVACGGEHTAVLSKDGMVCTFGAGCYGQLGHNCRRNELVPRFVAELFGVRVSEVTCGRWHTLVYIRDLGKVYAFGCGSEGQLGNGRKCDQLIPLPVSLAEKEGSASEEKIKIIAGENQSIVLCMNEKHSYANLNRTLARIEEDETDKWVSNLDPNRWQNIKQDIKLIFSSVACVNGSFLNKSQDGHFRTSQKDAGINMSAVLLFSDKIAEEPKVYTQVMNAVKKLIESLPSSATSPEELRVFLILPIILRKQVLQSESLLTQLAHVTVRLPPEGKQMLESLWSNLDVHFFKDLVDVYQRVSSVKISSIIAQMRSLESVQRHRDVIWPLQILQVLCEINSRTGCRIQEKNFYVPEVKKILTPPKWILSEPFEQAIRRFPSKVLEMEYALKVLNRVPCILDMEAKILLHEMDRHLFQIMHTLSNPFVVTQLHVRRQHLAQDTWVCIRNMSENNFQHFLKVCFIGERGVDDGGLSQEFFTVLTRELCAPEAGIFQLFEESQLIWFSSEVPAQEDIYFLIGNVFGMALYNNKIAAFPFPLALFKKLANVPLTLDDLIELSPTEGRCLQELLDEQYCDNLESMMLDFTVIKEDRGSKVSVDLKENGASILVTKFNRKEYVDAYVNYLFNDSIEEQFQDFRCGFLRGCPTDMWRIFLPVELQVVLVGDTKYDWEQLEKNAKYYDYDKSDETIEYFWAVFRDLPEEKKKDFLAFLTGTNRIPCQGMAKFVIEIEHARKEDPDHWYPVACTCSRTLRLPRYSNRDVLREKLLFALEHYEKFGLS